MKTVQYSIAGACACPRKLVAPSTGKAPTRPSLPPSLAFLTGGELGHIKINPYGYKCSCGNHGCLEAYRVGSYIVGRVQEKIKSGYRGSIWDIIGGNVDLLHTGHIEEAYVPGDEFCVYAWREVIEYMGAAMASIANLINPEVIILGGGVVYGTHSFTQLLTFHDYAPCTLPDRRDRPEEEVSL